MDECQDCECGASWWVWGHITPSFCLLCQNCPAPVPTHTQSSYAWGLTGWKWWPQQGRGLEAQRMGHASCCWPHPSQWEAGPRQGWGLGFARPLESQCPPVYAKSACPLLFVLLLVLSWAGGGAQGAAPHSEIYLEPGTANHAPLFPRSMSGPPRWTSLWHAFYCGRRWASSRPCRARWRGRQTLWRPRPMARGMWGARPSAGPAHECLLSPHQVPQLPSHSTVLASQSPNSCS